MSDESVLNAPTLDAAPERPPALTGWRVVDIVVASVIGVLGGLVFALFNATYTSVFSWLSAPFSAAYLGVWLFPGVLGMLVVRRLGAAVYAELLAALVSALIGNQWGFSTLYYGLLEGLGAELVFAALLYRRFGALVSVLAGAGAGVAAGLLDVNVYYLDLTPAVKTGYVGVAIVSGAVIAGFGSYLLATALARTGVLAPLASGRAAERV